MKALIVIGGFVLFAAIVVAAGYLVEKLTDIEDPTKGDGHDERND